MTDKVTEKGRTFVSNDEGVRRQQRARGARRTLIALCATTLALALVSASVAGLELARATGRVLPGVHVGALDLSRLTPQEAAAKLLEFARAASARPLRLKVGGASVSVSSEEVGFAIDAPANVTRALAVGRGGGTLARVLGVTRRWFRAEVIPLEAHVDDALLARRAEEWSRALVSDPPFSGGLRVSGASIEAEYPHAGHVLDARRLAPSLRDAWLSGASEVPLVTAPQTPSVARAEVDRVVAEARRLASAPLELAAPEGGPRVTLSAPEMAAILAVVAVGSDKLELRCDAGRVAQLLEPRRAELERSAQDATFQVDDKDQVHVLPGHAATLLDAARVAEAACRAAASDERRGELPLTAGAAPALSTEAALALGVRGLVSSFSTHHACCQPRVQNIHHIADLLRGTLVRPGETFSINQKIGPRSPKNGFLPAPSIEDGDMVDTIGGGVSQFATTIFNALFYGGYDIIERQPHTYWFTRYPMGFDATLSFPHPDIVFKNDTDAGVLIETAYTDTTITVKLYGDNGGRKVRAQISEKQNIVQPPLEYVPNRSLDADKEKTREGGMIGWSVIVKRILTFPDGQTKEEKRKVTYKPKARRVEVHPCRIPAGEPGHTGERCPVPEASEGEPTPAQ